MAEDAAPVRLLHFMCLPFCASLLTDLKTSELSSRSVNICPCIALQSLGKMRLAVGQMTATNNIDANFAACSRLAKSAADEGCGLLALPECFAFIGECSCPDFERLFLPLPLPCCS